MLTRTVVIPAKGRAEVVVEELDTSNLQPNEAIIQAEASMISAGTELSRVLRSKKVSVTRCAGLFGGRESAGKG
jgi:hypothetical protein